MGRLGDARLANGFFKGLGSYLKHPVDAAEGGRRLDRQLAARERSFVAVLEQGVFENPASPYRRLFEWAGVELGMWSPASGTAASKRRSSSSTRPAST